MLTHYNHLKLVLVILWSLLWLSLYFLVSFWYSLVFFGTFRCFWYLLVLFLYYLVLLVLFGISEFIWYFLVFFLYFMAILCYYRLLKLLQTNTG